MKYACDHEFDDVNGYNLQFPLKELNLISDPTND